MIKNKFLKIVSLLSVFAFCSCFNLGNKEISKMNLIELNQYNNQLKEENERLTNENESFVGISDGKTYQELLEMINHVNEEIIKSNVMITNQSRVLFQTASISSGSGTIIKEDASYYYVLTNNHVIYSFGANVSYYVYDYLNNEYSKAKVLFSNPDYDLAILRFSKGKAKLRVAKLSENDAEVEDNVIVIGQPQGQRNTVTYGEVLSYGKVDCPSCNEEESNIKYDCVYYDAITTNGNSGGMILNYNYELVGVVTFGMNDSSGKYLYGAGSPVSKVKEFMLNNDFEVGDLDD